MLVQVWFGCGVPRVFSISRRASTEAAPEAGLSLQDTAMLWREGKSDEPSCWVFFSCKSKVTPPSKNGDGFQVIKGSSSSRDSAGLENSVLCAPTQYYVFSRGRCHSESNSYTEAVDDGSSKTLKDKF